jgi:hypothetical protein
MSLVAPKRAMPCDTSRGRARGGPPPTRVIAGLLQGHAATVALDDEERESDATIHAARVRPLATAAEASGRRRESSPGRWCKSSAPSRR